MPFLCLMHIYLAWHAIFDRFIKALWFQYAFGNGYLKYLRKHQGTATGDRFAPSPSSRWAQRQTNFHLSAIIKLVAMPLSKHYNHIILWIASPRQSRLNISVAFKSPWRLFVWIMLASIGANTFHHATHLETIRALVICSWNITTLQVAFTRPNTNTPRCTRRSVAGVSSSCLHALLKPLSHGGSEPGEQLRPAP